MPISVLEQDGTDYVVEKLRILRERAIWPNGLRYLWTDAFGVILLVSLFEKLQRDSYFAEAEWVASEVYRILGQKRGIRIGEERHRDGQYFHYLTMWLFALRALGRHVPRYKTLALSLVHETHDSFMVPGRGVIWKMTDDLSQPYPGFGFGALDPFGGYVTYRLLDEKNLERETSEMEALVEEHAPHLRITQDLGIGMMLWMTHFFAEEAWAIMQKVRCLKTLDRMWKEDGFFCRDPQLPEVKFAFTNYGVSIGLQSVAEEPGRVRSLNSFFERYQSHDEYDEAAITHVMACSSHFPGLLV